MKSVRAIAGWDRIVSGECKINPPIIASTNQSGVFFLCFFLFYSVGMWVFKLVCDSWMPPGILHMEYGAHA